MHYRRLATSTCNIFMGRHFCSYAYLYCAAAGAEQTSHLLCHLYTYLPYLSTMQYLLKEEKRPVALWRSLGA